MAPVRGAAAQPATAGNEVNEEAEGLPNCARPLFEMQGGPKA